MIKNKAEEGQACWWWAGRGDQVGHEERGCTLLTLDYDMTVPHLTFPSLSRAAVRGHCAPGARAEPDPCLLPSPAHLWHHEQPTRRGRRRERSEGLCKGAGLSPVPGRAGIGGPEPLIRTPVRGQGKSLGGGKQERAPSHRLLGSSRWRHLPPCGPVKSRIC